MCRFISYCTTNTHSQCLRRHCMTDTYIHEACVARRNPISQAWFHTFDAIQHIFLDCRSPTRSCANACKPRNIHKHTGLMPIHVKLTSRLRSHTRTSSPTPLMQRSPFAEATCRAFVRGGLVTFAFPWTPLGQHALWMPMCLAKVTTT